jgi:hypothetical protein
VFPAAPAPIIGATCIVDSTADCARSSSCKTGGYCGTWDARPDVGCTQTDGGCAKSTACRERGECELVTLGPGNFPHTTCMARTDAECAKSEACSKLHRCRERGGACVP